VTVVAATSIIFFIANALPGDPAAMYLGTDYSLEEYYEMRRIMRLDEPLYIRYFGFFSDLLRGSLGTSFGGLDVAQSIAIALPRSIAITAPAVILTLSIGFLVGTLAAINKNNPIDYSSMFVTLVGLAMPSFAVSIVLILIFAFYLGWLPVGGFQGLNPTYLLLPVTASALHTVAIQARLARTSMLEVLNNDYVWTARSKGLSEWKVILKHAARNAFIPNWTNAGLSIGVAFSGSLYMEIMHSVPGIGRLMYNSLLRNDIPMMVGIIFVVTTAFIFINLLVDLSYTIIDPRIRVE